NDTLSYALKSGGSPSKGSVAFDQANGTFTYTPNANANGSDTFTIQVSDGHGGTADQGVSVTINPVNDPPTPPATSPVTTNEDTASIAKAIGASDVDCDTLFYALKSGAPAPTQGSVAFDQANGTFIYTPNANANGSDSFTIQVSDGHGDTVGQAVSVTI